MRAKQLRKFVQSLQSDRLGVVCPETEVGFPLSEQMRKFVKLLQLLVEGKLIPETEVQFENELENS